MFKTIICPIDGSDHAIKAQDLAISLAAEQGATLIFLHTLMLNAKSDELMRFAQSEGLAKSVEPAISHLRAAEARLEYGYGPSTTPDTRALTEIGESLLQGAKRDAGDRGVKTVDTILTSGDPADAILRAIKEKDADCVVIGSRGLGDMRALFLGSVSHKVLNQAPCTCIAVK